MKTTFLSRASFINKLYQGYLQDHYIISISDDVFEEMEMRSICKDNCKPSEQCLFLHFADVEDGYSGFTQRTAMFIIRHIVKAFENNKGIVVHCLVGQSRSGAIAKFINDYWGLSDEYLSNFTGYNTYVYSELEKCFLRGEY